MTTPWENARNGSGREYIARINRVLDYIEQNIDRELTLDELAAVACFSRFHFHRLFKSLVGETLSRFIQRVRLERAAQQLSLNPSKPITDIALDCGFSGPSTFSRAFREAFGVSPSEWRARPARMPEMTADSNPGKTVGNGGQARAEFFPYTDEQFQHPFWRFVMKEDLVFDVEVRDLPELTVAYIRHIGPYKGDSALFDNLFTRLMSWAGPRNLLRFPETKVLTVAHDDPNVTADDKLRISVCISIPGDAEVDGEVGRMTVPGGRFAVARFELLPTQYEAAWNAVMGDWLPGSGYQPDDRLCYESYLNDPKTHPEGKHIVEICLPVRPL